MWGERPLVYFSPDHCYKLCPMLIPGFSKLVLIAILAAGSVLGLAAEPADGTLLISYAFSTAQDLEPSYQIAIWLEKEDGQFVRTLFISEYLAYGGFNDPTICPDWTKIAEWDKATEAEYDAVSKPTPPIGSNTLKLDCKARGIEPGTYVYCVEVHIVENFNILYKGKIAIGAGAAEDTAVATYIPSKHESAANVIHGVAAKYIPGGASAPEERKP
ncbi:MAG: DUF2271 domain-containing protein [Acidobacteria bacterium]|nr:MAG: DUF2271 domain-containing protein [Acidobacteriota bacterium]